MTHWGSEEVWIRFVVAAMATWRVAHLVAHEDGPWDVIAWLRSRAGSGVLGSLLDCFYCLSMWVAVPFTAVVTVRLSELVPTWLAVSGAACLLERATAPRAPIEPLLLEPPAAAQDLQSTGPLKGGNDVLWTETSPSGGADRRPAESGSEHAAGAVPAATDGRPR